ncbi:hypothetical protein [Alcaligenes sp. SJTW-7]|uniref:hypothetical protein n=1 Tax=Alcaligenes sp. SJTW-7 TaxID=3078429 RepID=UPI0039ECDD52
MSVKAKTREIAIEPGPTGVFLGYKSAGVSANDKRYRSTIKSYPEGKKDDWSGLYVAEDRLTAEGYLPDALPPDGTGEAYINLIYIETSPVNKFAGKGKKTHFVDIAGNEIADPEIPQSEKSKLVREALSEIGIKIPDDKPLIQSLGLQGFIYRGPHTASEEEIIIPFNFINGIRAISLANFQTFKFRDHMPVGSPVLNPALGIGNPDASMRSNAALPLAP